MAVSGGADSLALAQLLIMSRRYFGFEICIAHFEHGLRGKESIDDALFVKKFASERKINFFYGQGNVKKFATQNKISIETAARDLRYKFLNNVRREQMFDAIALAHHADDQCETILMRLIRGVTSSGLGAMKMKMLSKDYGILIRPLLKFRKSSLEEFCHSIGLIPRIDSTNFETIALRNKVRLEIIPILEKINPSLVENFGRLGEISADEATFIEIQSRQVLSNVIKKNFIIRAEFIKLPPALQRVVVKKFLEQNIDSVKDFGFIHFEGIRRVLVSNLSGVELPENLRANLKKGKLYITKNF